MKMKRFLLIFSVILIPHLLYSQDVKSIFGKSKTSIVLILTYDANNTPIALGSGFYFENTLIATNYHVIEGSSKIVIKNLGSQTKLENIKVRSYSEDLDMAILESPTPNSTFLTLSQIKPEIGDKIVAIGNPKGLEGTVSTGIVSGLRELTSEYSLIQITSPISPGSSGGPVLNENGQVIGISTFTINDSQNLNFAIPSIIISSLKLKSSKWEPQVLSSLKTPKDEKNVVVAFFDKAGSDYEEVISLKNNSTNSIKNIKGLLLYFDKNKNPLSYQLIELEEVLLPGMSKMKKIRSFDQNQNFYYLYGKSSESEYHRSTKYPFTIEFRLLDYDIVENSLF